MESVTNILFLNNVVKECVISRHIDKYLKVGIRKFNFKLQSMFRKQSSCTVQIRYSRKTCSSKHSHIHYYFYLEKWNEKKHEQLADI